MSSCQKNCTQFVEISKHRASLLMPFQCEEAISQGRVHPDARPARSPDTGRPVPRLSHKAANDHIHDVLWLRVTPADPGGVIHKHDNINDVCQTDECRVEAAFTSTSCILVPVNHQFLSRQDWRTSQSSAAIGLCSAPKRTPQSRQSCLFCGDRCV